MGIHVVNPYQLLTLNPYQSNALNMLETPGNTMFMRLALTDFEGQRRIVRWFALLQVCLQIPQMIKSRCAARMIPWHLFK